MSLPVADAGTVRRHVFLLLRRHRMLLIQTVSWFGIATVCGLAVPALLGGLVGAAQHGLTAHQVEIAVLLIAAALLAQTVLTQIAALAGARLGEQILAEIREEFIDRVLTLPMSLIEQVGTGDLIARSSRDTEALSDAVRIGGPTIVVAGLSVVLTIGALLLTSPIMVLPALVAVPLIYFGTRWYLRRARTAYLAEAASYSDLLQGMTETFSGAKTVETFGLSASRVRRVDADIKRSTSAEFRTLFLRTVWFPLMDLGYILPVAATLLFGGLFYFHHWVSLGEVTAAALYARSIITPLDTLVGWLDALQVGDASLARLVGVSYLDQPPAPPNPEPAGSQLDAADLRYSYVPGKDVLDGIDLQVRPGERLAIVGPSGAGKSTLGRILAGIYPPRTGSVRLGGVDLADLAPERLRREVVLVTQEHHVFLGTIRENIALARPGAADDAVTEAAQVVGAMEWIGELPDGLDTEISSTGWQVSPGQAQQIALARLVLADPHTLVLDEATSALDPRAARQLEQSLAAVLAGRTVIAIAHRLHTAHDADTVAVMHDGRVTELGPHDELVASGGAYAGLWDSWHGGSRTRGLSDQPIPAGHEGTQA